MDAAVFGFSSGDTIFSVDDSIVKRSIVIGSIAAGLGIVIDAWLLFRYSGSSVQKFQVCLLRVIPVALVPQYKLLLTAFSLYLNAQRCALDVYGTYFFFCLTCRLPTLCLFLSASSLMVFLLTVAYDAWPTAVLVMSFIAGIMMSLQYLIFGFHRLINAIVWVVRWCWLGVGRLLGRREAGAGTGTGQPAASSCAQDVALGPQGQGSPARPSMQSERPPSYTSDVTVVVSMPEPDTNATGMVGDS